MNAGIYFALFVVLFAERPHARSAIYFLSADLQTREMFIPRKPLSPNVRRAGWQGYLFDCSTAENRFVRLAACFLFLSNATP